MKTTRNYLDLDNIFDEIFEAAQSFKDEFRRNMGEPYGPEGRRYGPFGKGCGDDNIDYYPNYSYPPMNVYMVPDRSMIFEFALAGFDEKDISLSFQGDYMVFSALVPAENADALSADGGEIRYFKHRLKMKDIEKQKYYVPLDKYAQERVKAVYRSGILKVTIPPKEVTEQNSGIKIEIVKEGT